MGRKVRWRLERDGGAGVERGCFDWSGGETVERKEPGRRLGRDAMSKVALVRIPQAAFDVYGGVNEPPSGKALNGIKNPEGSCYFARKIFLYYIT